MINLGPGEILGLEAAMTAMKELAEGAASTAASIERASERRKQHLAGVCAFTDDDIEFLTAMGIGDAQVHRVVSFMEEIGLHYICAACKAGKHGEWEPDGCDCFCHPLAKTKATP
jgi:hypothetical protein